MAAIPSLCSEAGNKLSTCGPPVTYKNKELCNAEAHVEGRGQHGAVEHANRDPCLLIHETKFLSTDVSVPIMVITVDA